MTLKKLKNDHYIIVDDSEIKEGDYYLRYNQSIMKCTSIKLQFNEALNKEETIICSDGCGDPYERSKHFLKKITHSTQPLELLTLSENGLSGMGFSKVRPLNIFNVKELLGEVDVEKKAEKHAQKMWGEYVGDVFTHNDIITDKTLGENTIYDFKSGYNQALEDNKEKKYTEEDMLNALYSMWYKAKNGDFNINEAVKASIDYVQPKTSWGVQINSDGKLELIK